MSNFSDRACAIMALHHSAGECSRSRARDAKLRYVTAWPEDLALASRIQREIDQVAEQESAA